MDGVVSILCNVGGHGCGRLGPQLNAKSVRELHDRVSGEVLNVMVVGIKVARKSGNLRRLTVLFCICGAVFVSRQILNNVRPGFVIGEQRALL